MAEREGWEIETVNEDGSAVCVDGTVLNSRHENPWYVLATLYGEQGERINPERHAKNRRAWNLWAGQGLSDAAREKLAEQMGLDTDELGGAWEAEKGEILRRFRERLGKAADLPDPGAVIDFDEVYFAKDTRVRTHSQ